jgi:hypothetical protein
MQGETGTWGIPAHISSEKQAHISLVGNVFLFF